MTTIVLNQVAPQWRRHFCDVGRAIQPIVSRPVRLRLAMGRWSAAEPELSGVEPAHLFERLGMLDEPQVRALIRIARSSDPDAEAATWVVICQFLPVLQSIARADALTGNGTEGPRATVNTAVAELWRQIHRIDLETNKASIFFALATRVRRATAPTGRGCWKAQRFVASLVDPTKFGSERHTAEDEPDRSPLRRSANRPRTSWLDPDPTGGASAYDEADWRLAFDDLVDYLTDFLTEDVAALFNWNPEHHRFERQHQRLHDYMRVRVAAAAQGSRATSASIAADIGASPQTIRDLQKEVSRALRTNSDRYRAVILATLDGHEPARAA